MFTPIRIASANCGSIWSQTFSYDPFGNLEKSGTMTFTPNYSETTNRITTVGGFAYTYDADGNVTADSISNTFSWNSNGGPRTVDGVAITYDALGRMVEQDNNGAYTEIVYGPTGAKLALMNGQALTKAFVALPAGATAVYSSSGLEYYRHADWLGSSRLTSTPSRTVSGDVAYAPFGETYAQSGGPDLSFTGQDAGINSTLYDFMYREYGIQGRWQSPDPLGPGAFNLADPQTLDLYSYVRNSPTSLVDPDGLQQIDCSSPHVRDEGWCEWQNSFFLQNFYLNGEFNQFVISPGGCTTEGCIFGTYPVPHLGSLAYPWPGVWGGSTPQSQTNCSQGLREAGQYQGAVNRTLQSWGLITAAATDYNIPPAMLAAVGVRETGFTDTNQIGGGAGVGAFQLTVSPRSGVTAAQANDLVFSTFWAAGKLSYNIGFMAAKFPNFTATQNLQAAAAAYNFGVQNISGNPATIGVGTTGDNYGSDILLLMDCYDFYF